MNTLIARLEHAIVTKQSPAILRVHGDALLAQVQNPTIDPPSWQDYPIARTWFTQHYL